MASNPQHRQPSTKPDLIERFHSREAMETLRTAEESFIMGIGVVTVAGREALATIVK